jgi:hypothetical protein
LCFFQKPEEAPAAAALLFVESYPIVMRFLVGFFGRFVGYCRRRRRRRRAPPPPVFLS